MQLIFAFPNIWMNLSMTDIRSAVFEFPLFVKGDPYNGKANTTMANANTENVYIGFTKFPVGSVN